MTSNKKPEVRPFVVEIDHLEVKIPVPIFTINIRRLQTIFWTTHWQRSRGGWPLTWRNLPPVDGEVKPIYRWWALGPVEVRVFRWRA